MRPRLHTALVCAALAGSMAGCHVDQGGLQGKIAAPSGNDDQPVTPGSVGEDTPKPPKSDQPPTKPPASSPDAGAPAMPPSSSDASAPAPDPDAAPAPVTPATPDAAPVNATPPECDQPPSLPLRYSYRRDVPDSDDFTFDNEGYFVARNGRDITRLAFGGMPQMVVRNAVAGRSTIDSMRVLPGGDILIVDYEGDQLTRVDLLGKSRQLAHMNSPNKLTFGPGGRVFTVGIEGDVWVSDPDSGKTTQIAHVDGGRLRGLTFSLDYKTLYASDARNGQIDAIALRDDGGFEAPRVWVRNVGPGPDGMTTDACGNIYLADHTSASLRRISPAGDVQVVANLNNGPTSAVGFGSGQHGWDARHLYTVNADRGGMYDLDVGVPAAPPPPP